MSAKYLHHHLVAPEKGAVLVEAVPAIAIFLLSLFFLIELSRFTYISLTSEFLVIEAARFAAIVGKDTPPATDPVTCCNDRVNAIKNAVSAASSNFYFRLNANTEVFVCAVDPDTPTAVDCNLCDGPGFRRNAFLQVQINRNVGMFTWLNDNLWRVKRTALTKTESQILDCSL